MYHNVPYHTVPYHAIPYHTTIHHTIPHHTIPYHTIPYHTTIHHTIQYHTIPQYTIPYYITPCYLSDEARPKSKCEKERDAVTNGSLLVGAFTPQCEDDGSYSAVQCHGSTGYCWCVDGEGNKLVETEIKFDTPNCTKGETCTIMYHTTPCHTMPYHTIPQYTIPYHTIPYHTIQYHTIPQYTIPYNTIPYHNTPYHTTLHHVIFQMKQDQNQNVRKREML